MRVTCEDPFPHMTHVLRPGRGGDAESDFFTVTEDGHDGTASIEQARTWPGVYARLTIMNEMVMTDTASERCSNAAALLRAHGAVLLGGLGIALVTLAAIRKATVESVTVVEVNLHLDAGPRTALRFHLSRCLAALRRRGPVRDGDAARTIREVPAAVRTRGLVDIRPRACAGSAQVLSV